MAAGYEKTGVAASDGGDTSSLSYVIHDVDLDQQTQLLQNEIEREIAESQPLVSDKIRTTQLQSEYASDDKIYQDKVAELMKKYQYIRRTRGDGNCFYRAFAFGYLEKNLVNKKELERFRQLTYDLKDQLVKLGYQDFTLEDVRGVVIEIIDNISKEGTEQCLIESFCSPSYSNYFVAYLRLFASGYLQMNREFFENFIEDGKSIKEFCCTEVEPMERESDNIHIIALTKAAVVPLRVIYMDRSQQSSLTIHDFAGTDEETNESFEPMITMLYRPGHYDLLYET
ncbi:unnamed protein product [Rotaria magnacalcarata]|uniref:Ubiquitin thioesterase n=1 Tax=Rotaria magnacalcarata TaxID=392030 RepID=A0A815K0I9_9BILA|nr:unnamed protein product [Rotaria magnacalcarata]CAF1473201.1 unnamed protein product [Rotaria magnacalcarata]CAF1985900.1 unnamed protein product [Rotaria magnacalcarata]CAF2001728.1 unnamed protein product [Rotaria magnacalcarata]CAF2078520.1 unnamed protein product [Rotaria magnacalcarata]